jgi:hypothetical protein
MAVALVGCDSSVNPSFVGGTTPALTTDAQGKRLFVLRVDECTEARFEETITTQGPEDDNKTLYSADEASADDPSVLDVAPTGRFWRPTAPPSTGQTNWFADDTPASTFSICARKPGNAVVRVSRCGDLKATLGFVVRERP